MNLRDLATLNYGRAIVLMAGGAVLGLGLAAYSLFTAQGTSTLIVPPEYVALVNQQPIARSDYLAQLRALYDVGFAEATPQQRKTVLDDMIREELFVQRGTELNVAGADPETRAAMVSAVEQQAATDAMTSVPDDKTLLAYYEANKPRYSTEAYFTAREIVFPAGVDIGAARRLAPDAAIARFGGKDSGRLSGPEFYFAAPIHLGASLAQQTMALDDGAVSAAVVRPDGVHLVYMQKNVRAQAVPFAEGKARVLADYRKENAARMQAHERDFLRKRANILVADDLK